MSPERKKEKNEGKSDRTLTLRLMRSGICTPRSQKATLRSLGLRRMGQLVEKPDDASIRGMVLKVRHLVEIVKG